MTSSLKLFLARDYWLHMFSIRRAGSDILAALGILWTIVEASSFFSSTAGDAFKRHWVLFLLAGLAYALYENWPRTAVSARLDGRDIVVELRVGNIFSLEGDLVVGTNTTFETELGASIISPASIQGQFTQKYYDNAAHLANDLLEELRHVPSTPKMRAGRTVKKYRMGTVARVQSRNRTAHFVAIADLNEHGVASSSFRDLQECLPALWQHMFTKGGVGPLLIPVLGTGFSRLPTRREEIIREIVQSFVAACAERRFCERLTIVVSPRDYRRYDIDLRALGRFITHVCRYTQFSSPNSQGAGQPVGPSAPSPPRSAGPRTLPVAMMHALHRAATEAGLGDNRSALLSGIERSIVASLPLSPDPTSQLLSDLMGLNDIITVDGSTPIEHWLTNAITLRPVHKAADTFKQALAQISGTTTERRDGA